MSLFENKNYKVELNDTGDGYAVVNLETGVTEFESTSLPRSIIVADESEGALDRYLKVSVEGADAPNVFPLR